MTQKIWSPLLKLAGIAFILSLAFWLALTISSSSIIGDIVFEYGYVGIFIVSVISGFNVVVPVPVVSFVPLFLEVGLNFWIVIATMVAGLTLADLLGYVIGRSGRELAFSSHHKKIFKRLDNMKSKHYFAPIIALFFYASLVPFPNEILVIPLGFLGYRFIHVFVPLFLGNIIFTIFTSFGVINLFKLF